MELVHVRFERIVVKIETYVVSEHRMRKSGRLMRQSCYGPCVVFRNEAEATPLGAYEGAVKPDLDPGSRPRADQKESVTQPVILD